MTARVDAAALAASIGTRTANIARAAREGQIPTARQGNNGRWTFDALAAAEWAASWEPPHRRRRRARSEAKNRARAERPSTETRIDATHR